MPPIVNMFSAFRDFQNTGGLNVMGKGQPEFQLRKRLTIAQVNAGVDVVPAPGVGFKLRLIDLQVIAIGGNASGATTVDLTGTVAAAVVKLVAIAVAALTQSAVNRPGAANNTVLADGGSFVTLDANKPMRMSVTGSALATSTFVDVNIQYAVEQV